MRKAWGLVLAAGVLAGCGSQVPPLPLPATATAAGETAPATAVPAPGCWQAGNVPVPGPAFPWRWDAARGDWQTTAAAPTPYPTGPDTGWDVGSRQDPDSQWYTRPVIRQRSGLFWQDDVLPVTGGLATITVLPGGEVWALGSTFGQGPPGGASEEFGATLVVRGQPGHWTIDQLDEGTDLDRVLIRAADDIWLAGGIWFGGAGGAQSPAIRHWDGRHWQVASLALGGLTPLPLGDDRGRITTIAAPGGTLWAVGWSQMGEDGGRQPLVLRYVEEPCAGSVPAGG